MRYLTPRKATPKVVGGKVHRKNRWRPTCNYSNTPQAKPIIDRRKPGPGYRHVLKKRDVERFIDLLPDWNELSLGLNAIVLAAGSSQCDGWHRPGIVAVCAWSVDQPVYIQPWYYFAHRQVFEQLDVPCMQVWDGQILEHTYYCEFTYSTIRAYQLLHILLHELGHHHDRMTTKSKRRSSRGEGYAERYALDYADRIWERYLDEFGLP